MARSSAQAAPGTQAVRGFEDLSRADIAFAGGKGANLGELTAAGLPVPPGFVVGAPAYAAFLDASGLRERIAGRLSGLDVDDTAALESAAADVRAEIEEEPIPEAIRAEIARAYADHAGDDAPVAVRSSATAEDTASASFAGMNETYLNMTGAESVVEAVQRCWASLFGARTVFYRAKRGLSQADMDIAVVVQRQVPSTRAGVMFTVDPSTGKDDRLVIEGSFGLGEAVVSGSVSPDRWVVAKRSLHVLAREVRHKELAIEGAPTGHGTVVRSLGDAEAERPALSDDEVRQLAELGRRIEATLRLSSGHRMGVRPGRPRLDSPVSAGHVRGARRGRGRQGPATRTGSGSGYGLGTREDRRDARRSRFPHRGGRPRRPHDRTGLGTPDAPGKRHRDRLGWHDLPCRNRLPRARHPVSGGHRRRDHPPARRRAGHRGRRPGRGDRGARAEDRGSPAPPAALAGAGAAPVTGTQLLVNLSEPSQVERAAALEVEGVGLLRAELMILEALEGTHPRRLLEEGRGDEFVDRMADSLLSSRRASRRDRSPTGQSTSGRTSSAAWPAAMSWSPRRPTR